MTKMHYQKMAGLGNDFIIMDERDKNLNLTRDKIIQFSDRAHGLGTRLKGCDQFIVLRNPVDASADVRMDIYNADGEQVSACGNATRCIVVLMAQEKNKKDVVIETMVDLLEGSANGNIATVDMGLAKLDWRDIPMSHAQDMMAVDIEVPGFDKPVVINMGNPHCIFFGPEIDALDLKKVGPPVEHHSLFPERINVEFARVMDKQNIQMRVWERGAGITLACGTGACATGVAGFLKGLTDRKSSIHMPGGILQVEYLPDGHVLQIGETTFIEEEIF